MKTVCFDVGGTLIQPFTNAPRTEVIELLRTLQKLGYTVYVWSGGGIDYAKTWVNCLGLTNVQVIRKGSFKPDLAVDDMPDATLGEGLIWVGPVEPTSGKG
jgi:hydroxymethylpyrimidine pyrophosphatase-like HAD family hydrolase